MRMSAAASKLLYCYVLYVLFLLLSSCAHLGAFVGLSFEIRCWGNLVSIAFLDIWGAAEQAVTPTLAYNHHIKPRS